MKPMTARQAVSSPHVAGVALPGSVALLCVMSFVLGLPDAMLNPILPDVADGLGVSVAAVGQLSTVATLVGAVAALLVGTLSDLYGRRLFLLGGLVVAGLGTLALAVAPTFAWALASRVLVGFGMVFPVALALAGDWYTGSARDQASARMVAFIALAWVLGAPATAIVAQLGGWRMSLDIFGVGFLVVAVLGLMLLPSQPPPRRTGGLGVALGTIWRSHRHRPDLALVILANALRNASWLGGLAYMSIVFKGIYQLETWQLGLILATGALAYALGSEAAGRLARRYGLRSILVVGLVGSALSGAILPSLSFLPLSLADDVALCVLSGVANAAFTALTLGMAPETRGATMALSTALAGFAGALGVMVAGLCIALLGYSGLGISMLGFALLSLVLVSWPGFPRLQASAV